MLKCFLKPPSTSSIRTRLTGAERGGWMGILGVLAAVVIVCFLAFFGFRVYFKERPQKAGVSNYTSVVSDVRSQLKAVSQKDISEK